MNEIKNPLTALIQKNQFIGWTCRMDYEQAVVLTSDDLKAKAKGVPLHCFLLATSFDPKKSGDEMAGEIILLRVTGSAPLPLDGDLMRTKVEALQNRALKDSAGELAKAEFQFGGLQCRILGTFYNEAGKLRLGSDLENYSNAVELEVYRPSGAALE